VQKLVYRKTITIKELFFNSQNSKCLGNQNLLDTQRSKLVFNYPQQDNDVMLIYKYCGNKRLNVTSLLELVGGKWR